MKTIIRSIWDGVLIIAFTTLVAATAFGLSQNQIYSIQQAHQMANTPDLSLID